ncbi:CaiB/BaiF CoA transferase family protein [Naumannella halotolerans]|uniref:CaiB/BaiF CoA transferase family protein n=1 Tax=Naumannella halotolerans TaxID=993414 RepID=UPI00370D9408
MSGPLAGVRVLELAAIGPGPFAGMLLADLGAEVIRVDRLDDLGDDAARAATHKILDRGRRSIAVDLKNPAGRDLVLDLAERAEVLIEGFRPGVTERLGLGPDDVRQRNRALVYGRMTGWGQSGPLAERAGHDLDYIALSGALALVTDPDGRPRPPLNLLGDFAGGSLYLVAGVLAALLHARQTGEGQVVDAAIVDGAASLTAMHHSMVAADPCSSPSTFDGSTPFYRVYRTADDRWLAVGALEPQFFGQLVRGLDVADRSEVAEQYDRQRWPAMQELFEQTIAEQTLATWEERFAGTDACVAPVRDAAEAPTDTHLAARRTYLPAGNGWQPAPAPRLSATPGELPAPAPRIGQHTEEIVIELGADPAALRARGAIG